MPKKAKELSAIDVRRLNEPGFHAVGGVAGLLLQVTDTGARSWVLRVRVGAKRRGIGLGGFPDVSLADARDDARAKRRQITEGIDPVAEKKAKKHAMKVSQLKALTFEQAARKAHAARQAEFRNAKHRKDWLSSLERYAFDAMGKVLVADVEMAHVMKVLEPIWSTRTETATRVRQRIETVLNWATVSGHRQGDNPARWRGNLEAVLPKPTKITTVGNQPALPWQRVPEFMRALREREGMGARALEFAILTAARSGEVRGATWAEIDLDRRVWTIPAERMKASKPHRVPLSDAALMLLKAMPRMDGSEAVFTAPRGGVLSDMTLSAVVRRMHADDKQSTGGWIDPQSGKAVVPHGFRSSFKDWARSQAVFPDEVSELALAHVNSDATRAAYARDELMPQRAKMMQSWSDYCEQTQASGVVEKMRRKAD